MPAVLSSLGLALLLLTPPPEPAAPPSKLDRLWDDLARSNAAAGQEAVWALVADPEHSVPLLRSRLLPVDPKSPGARVAHLIEQLDSNSFREREQAMRDLRGLGQAVVPALRQTLGKKRPLEVVRRVRLLLDRLSDEELLVPAGDDLRAVRAIQVLERIDTPAARAALAELARRPAADRTTLEAKRALERLAERQRNER